MALTDLETIKQFVVAPTPLFSVMGSWGFVGSEICKDSDFLHNEPDNYEFKNKFTADYPDIVYCISTVHNYHVIDNDPYTDIATNLNHMMGVLQANRIKYGNDFTFTFVSSWFVYGDVPLPAKEDAHCDPKGFYSITKRTAEQLLISYCETFGINYKIVRLANVLGVGDKKASARKNALQWMIRNLVNGLPVEIYDGGVTRDYLHVSDAAEAIRHVAKYGKFGEIYNAGGSGIGYDIKALIQYANAKVGNPNVTTKPVPEFHKTVQVKDMWLDVTKITELGWKPKRQIHDIIDELVEDTYAEQG
jgi:nucleoside-diphosphate-sugar epimerase